MALDAPETRDLVADLARELVDLRLRVEALEARDAMAPASTRSRAVAEAAPATPLVDPATLAPVAVPVAISGVRPAPRRAGPSTTDVFGHFGRALVALGGAFFLRSWTDSGLIPPLLGVAAGLAYAGLWLFLGDRAAAAGRRLPAILRLVVCLLIGGPLVAETSLRLHLLPPALAAVLLLVVGLAQMTVACRHQFRSLAWLSALSASGLLLVLAIGSGDLVPFVLALLAACAALETGFAGERWLSLRWPFSLAADATLVLLFALLLREGGMPEAYHPVSRGVAAALGLALATLAVVAAALRTLRGGRLIGLFEIVQGALALAIGFGGAWQALGETGATLVGVAGLALSAGCYFVAFDVIDSRSGPDRNFYAYATFGAGLALVGARALLDADALAALLAGLSVLAATLGARFDRGTLRWHSLVFLVSASLASGLLGTLVRGLFGQHENGLGWGALATLVCTVVCAQALARGVEHDWSSRRAPLVVAELFVAFSATSLLAAGLGFLAPHRAGAADAGLEAAAGTLVLTAGALALGKLWKSRQRPEWRWFAVGWLVLAGLKLLVQDLPQGRPLSLFLALACVGGALMTLPRLLSVESESVAEPEPEPETENGT